jgi:hypothetical protein
MASQFGFMASHFDFKVSNCAKKLPQELWAQDGKKK